MFPEKTIVQTEPEIFAQSEAARECFWPIRLSGFGRVYNLELVVIAHRQAVRRSSEREFSGGQRHRDAIERRGYGKGGNNLQEELGGG